MTARYTIYSSDGEVAIEDYDTLEEARRDNEAMEWDGIIWDNVEKAEVE